jgi:hypothetical protein
MEKRAASCAALAAARARYGEKLVEWVLAHESVIVGTLSQ